MHGVQQGCVMRWKSTFALVLLALAGPALLAGTQESSASYKGTDLQFDWTLGGQVAALPASQTELWLDFCVYFSDFTATSETNLTLLPNLLVAQSFGLEYGWEGSTVGSDVLFALGETQFELEQILLYAEVGAFDTTLGEEDGEISWATDLGMTTWLCPAFAWNVTLDLEAEMPPFVSWSATELSLFPLAVDWQEFGVQWSLIDTQQGCDRQAAYLGMTAWLYPALAWNVTLDLEAEMPPFVSWSATDLNLLALGIDLQEFGVKWNVIAAELSKDTSVLTVKTGLEGKVGLVPSVSGEVLAKVEIEWTTLDEEGRGSIFDEGSSLELVPAWRLFTNVIGELTLADVLGWSLRLEFEWQQY